MRINPCADSRTAEHEFLKTLRRISDAFDRQFNLPRIAAKFLTESNRSGIVQMSATGIDNIVEGRCLLLQRIIETSQGRHEILAYRSEHGYMDGDGNYIVARLSHIHMIVWDGFPCRRDLFRSVRGRDWQSPH